MTAMDSADDRAALVKDLVLVSMADDYENLEIIIPHVTKWANTRGLELSRDQVIETLRAVVCEGYAQCYLLSPWPPHATVVAFDPEKVDAFYFYLTPRGKQIVKNTEMLGVNE